MADWGKIIEGAGYGVKATGTAVGTIASSIAARKANRQVNEQIDKQERRATNEFEAQYYQDPRQIASNHLMLSEMQKYLQEQRQARAASNAVTGGTEESLAAGKAIDNETVAKTTANMAASSEARRNHLRDAYNETMTGISNARISQIQNRHAQKQQNIQNWVGTVNMLGDSLVESGQGMQMGK